MNREKLIKMLDSDAIEDEGVNDSIEGAGNHAESIQAMVAKVREKKTKTGRVYGVPDKDTKRLTPKMQLFVNAILSGMTKVEAYKSAYNVRTENVSTVMGNINKLLKDRRVNSLLGSLDESLKERVIDDAVKTRRFVMERLHAKVLNAKTESAELKALELMGKAVAMFTDNVEQSVKQVSVQQLKEELRSHLTLLDNVKPIKQVA